MVLDIDLPGIHSHCVVQMRADGEVHIDVVSSRPMDSCITAGYSNMKSQHVHVLRQQPRRECASPGSSAACDSRLPRALSSSFNRLDCILRR
jgi:hypothetical protein